MKVSGITKDDLIKWAKTVPRTTPINMQNARVAVDNKTPCCLMANWALKQAKNIPDVHRVSCGCYTITMIDTNGVAIHRYDLDTSIYSIVDYALWNKVHTMGELLDAIAPSDKE